jgi:uncharacterized membrane protein
MRIWPGQMCVFAGRSALWGVRVPRSWPVPGKCLAKYAGGFGERRGIGTGVVEPEEWSRGFGWEPLGAGGDDQPGGLAVPTESVDVGAVGEPDPQVESSGGEVVGGCLGSVLSEGSDKEGLLARELGAWQTVSWALVLCAPLMVGLTVVSAVQETPHGTPLQWASFAYLGVVSMFLGFFAWYRGLAIGPMAQVSQVQLVQPVLSIAWAGLLLGERLTWTTILGGVVVILCAGSAVRARLGNPR